MAGKGEIIVLVGNPQQHEKEIMALATEAANRGHIPILPCAIYDVDRGNPLIVNFSLRERAEIMRNWARQVSAIATLVIVVNVDGQITPEMEDAIAQMSALNKLYVVDPNGE